MNYCVNHDLYPHHCRIYRKAQEDGGKNTQFNKKTAFDVVIYEGECIKYGSSQMRKFVNANVLKADYAVDIPYVIHGIHPGYLIDVTDGITTYTGVEIVTPYPDDAFGLGTTVFFNVVMN